MAPLEQQPGDGPSRADRWLSLGPASRLLGVDPDTLRRWADTGQVGSWVTPGGHRRFDRRDIERVAIVRRPHRAQPLSSLGASPERLTRVYRRHYRIDDLATSEHPARAQDREAFRRDGRRLIAVLVAFLDATGADPTSRERTEAEAVGIVEDQARRLATSGTSLTEAVALFVAARQPFLAELAGLGRRRSLDTARLASLYGDASALLDRLLLRFVDAHQRAG